MVKKPLLGSHQQRIKKHLVKRTFKYLERQVKLVQWAPRGFEMLASWLQPQGVLGEGAIESGGRNGGDRTGAHLQHDPRIIAWRVSRAEKQVQTVRLGATT